jgi:hypothetical protein
MEIGGFGIVTEEYGVLPIGTTGKIVKITQVGNKPGPDDVILVAWAIPDSYFEKSSLAIPDAEDSDTNVRWGRVEVSTEITRSQAEETLLLRQTSSAAEWARR